MCILCLTYYSHYLTLLLSWINRSEVHSNCHTCVSSILPILLFEFSKIEFSLAIAFTRYNFLCVWRLYHSKKRITSCGIVCVGFPLKSSENNAMYITLFASQHPILRMIKRLKSYFAIFLGPLSTLARESGIRVCSVFIKNDCGSKEPIALSLPTTKELSLP